uniref:Carboxypeptidase SOL1 n=1 Tax=Nicotiana tabacum TaxID=4097 RepID=A0A1S3X947_TOBAC|nr:PREDICTED: carboxypeptidase SOL1-like [Nicotiana tabacum]
MMNLFVFSLLFSSPFHLTFASGGFRSSTNLSGIVNSSSAASARHLFADNNVPFTEEQHLKRLEELAKDYMSNSDLENAIMSLNRRCSKISRVYSIGKSVLGVPLWVMEISDKPGKEEAEPAFKYIGNVHGDEPVGRELLILLANWLCDNYMKDPLATLIVDNVHLHILPSMNPDGFSLRRRGNANNIDLNRDFPDQVSLDILYWWILCYFKVRYECFSSSYCSCHCLQIHAREALADYHRLLAPGGDYEVVATMPGYKSRSTRIMLGEEAMTVDFVMDPVITPINSFLQRGWSCSLPGPHLEVFFILVLVLVSVFLCFLLKRRVVLNYPKQRQTKRSVLGV